MARVLPRYCPRCGAPVVTSEGACATCGLSFEALLSSDKHNSTELGSYSPDLLPEIDRETTLHNLEQQQNNQLDKVPTEQLGQKSNSLTGTQPLIVKKEPTFFSPSAQKSRKVGRKETVALLLIVLFVLGAIVYAFAGFLGLPLPGFVTIQPPITTTSINASVPYAGVQITVLTVQQSQSFIKDPNSNSNGMVRLNLQEQNPTNVKVVWSYAMIARLVMPDKTIVSPIYERSVVNVAPGTLQKNFVDFSVPTTIAVKQLTFVLGAPKEAQIYIPLVRNANVNKYQPKTTQLNGQMLYFGLNWTLVNATSSLSMPGQQAAKGMRYATLLLKVDNTLSQIAIPGSPYEYMRLQYGNTSVPPVHTTIPVAFQVGAVGVTGAVSFQIPQQASSFTLIFVPQKGDNGDQSSIDFHLT
jgi:hypothetical protein